MMWSDFSWFAVPAITLWGVAGTLVYTHMSRRVIDALMLMGIAVLATFIVGLWVGLERPPLRTMGETRLWYSFFLAGVGFITYKHWHYDWLLSFSSVVAIVFVIINLAKPEIHSKALMPALQSVWFVPHVIVYILSYAMLGAATIAVGLQIVKLRRKMPDAKLYHLMDNLVYVGYGFLMLGMLMGAVWAKEAWGHYWSWDPKETWALVTAGAYLLYIHMRLRKSSPQSTVWILPAAFVLLMITWIGVNYLPSAAASVHTYTF